MIYLKSMGLLAAALIFQSTLLQWSILSRIHPDFVILILVIISFRHGSLVGVFCGFTIGILQDVYAIETLGANAFAKSAAGYLIGLVDEKRFSLTPVTKTLFLSLAIFGHDLLMFMVTGLDSRTFLSALYLNTIPAIILTGIFGSPVFYILRRSSGDD